MLRVGLTGGYATGKTFVAHELARLGCHIVYADELGHAVLEPGAAAYAPTIEAFGADILSEGGHIDRKKLGSIVFNDPQKLKQLSSFVHPAVRALEEESINAWASEHPHGIAVIEAAILIEIGRQKDFDCLILTTCDPQTQIGRALKRDQLTEEQVNARIARQLPFSEKKRWADVVIDTSGAKEQTLRQIQIMFSALKQRAEA